MNIYKTRLFARWAKKEGLADKVLVQAIDELNSGLHDGNLSRHLFKKRVRKAGQGKRGAYRTIVAIQINRQAFFLFGFEKNQKSTLTANEQETLKEFAQEWLSMTEQKLKKAVICGEIIEVTL